MTSGREEGSGRLVPEFQFRARTFRLENSDLLSDGQVLQGSVLVLRRKETRRAAEIERVN
jgi:hypothetical protein